MTMDGMDEGPRCPALLVSAPASGQGKTTATAALARWYRRQGLQVRVFKTGPDFLDPMILARACGSPVYQLDLWMGGEAHCRALLREAATTADVILVEGVMGLHDGVASSASLAQAFGLPILAVIDGSAMAQTFGAIAHGLATYRPGLRLAGVLANRVGSTGHAQMLRESLPEGMRWFGALPRDEAYALPSRHLGLVQAEELHDLDARLDAAAEALGRFEPALPPAVSFAPTSRAGPGAEGALAPTPLAGVRIAVARDAAFSFLYPANLDVLEELGAQVLPFSPLDSPCLPDADALYLPGGYPELFLDRLEAHDAMCQSVREHHRQGKPIVAECGGMLALLDTLDDGRGRRAPLWGLLRGQGVMRPRFTNLGMQSVALPEGELRGHTFHHAEVSCTLPPLTTSTAQRLNGKPEPVWRVGRLHASFLHLYFPSNPLAVARLFSPDPLSIA